MLTLTSATRLPITFYIQITKTEKDSNQYTLSYKCKIENILGFFVFVRLTIKKYSRARIMEELKGNILHSCFVVSASRLIKDHSTKKENQLANVKRAPQEGGNGDLCIEI